MQPSFTFAITDASASAPLDGLSLVNLSITPSGGFDAAVVVTLGAALNGLTAEPLTIPAGSTTAQLEIGAMAPLSLGTNFTLHLEATSGSIVQTATVPATVTGAPGTLDMSFGNGGITLGPAGGGGGGGAVLASVLEVAGGKILVGGATYNSLGTGPVFGLRLLPSGLPDTSFNTTGTVTHQFTSTQLPSTGAFLREVDSSLVLAVSGYSGTADDAYLLRYQDNGAAATIMGDTGVDAVPLGGTVTVNAAALQPSSTNVLYAGTIGSSLFVARVNETLSGGFPDQSFAAPKGYVEPYGATASSATAFTFDADDNILVTGSVTGNGSDVALLRLTPSGALDTAFGSGGIVGLSRAGNQTGGAIAVQPDGDILVAATTDENSTNQLLVQRFLPTGAPDTTFGTNGVVLVTLGGSSNGTTALLVLMVDGRIVVAGNGAQNTVSGPVFARLTRNGSADPTFGGGAPLGIFVGNAQTISAMTLASSGLILIGGTVNSGPSGTFVGRLWN
jgi:uncharacterized delta-60 repeat protein